MLHTDILHTHINYSPRLYKRVIHYFSILRVFCGKEATGRFQLTEAITFNHLDLKLWKHRHSCWSSALALLKEWTISPAKVLCIEIWLQGMCYLLLE